jgi:hypothetical protein
MPRPKNPETIVKEIAAKKAENLLNIRNVSVFGGYALMCIGLTAGIVVASFKDANIPPFIMLLGMVVIAFGEMVEKRIKKILGG